MPSFRDDAKLSLSKKGLGQIPFKCQSIDESTFYPKESNKDLSNKEVLLKDNTCFLLIIGPNSAILVIPMNISTIETKLN